MKGALTISFFPVFARAVELHRSGYKSVGRHKWAVWVADKL